jgi:hypothetical protein
MIEIMPLSIYISFVVVTIQCSGCVCVFKHLLCVSALAVLASTTGSARSAGCVVGCWKQRGSMAGNTGRTYTIKDAVIVNRLEIELGVKR